MPSWSSLSLTSSCICRTNREYTRISAVGYGDSRPLQPNETAEGLTANRRVDLVVLSDQPERIRALLPIVPTLPEG